MSNVAETLQKELNEMKISRITDVESDINKTCIDCYVMTVDGTVFLIPKQTFEDNKSSLINGTMHPSKVTGLKCMSYEWDGYLRNERITIETLEINDPSKPNDDIVTAIF